MLGLQGVDSNNTQFLTFEKIFPCSSVRIEDLDITRSENNPNPFNFPECENVEPPS